MMTLSIFFDQMTTWLSQMNEGDSRDANSLQTIARQLDDILQTYPTDGDALAFSPSDGFTLGSTSPKLGVSTVDPADFFDFTSYELPMLTRDPRLLLRSWCRHRRRSDLVQDLPLKLRGTLQLQSQLTRRRLWTRRASLARTKYPRSSGTRSTEASPRFINASDSWKWDQPMSTVDQPWAILSSS